MPSPHQSLNETDAFTALMSGIALFIDDDIDNENDDAYKLKDQIIKRGIPLLSLRELPPKKEFNNFVSDLHGISFIILDWQFNSISSDAQLSGVRTQESTSAVSQEDVLDFIKTLLQKTYCPIFIFSRQSDSSINESLITANIIEQNGNPRVLIKSKKNLLGNKLFVEINTWINTNPIIYVLKTWEKAAKEAKLNMFFDLEKKSPKWVNILWKTFKEDDTDPSSELTQTLSTLFVNRLFLNCSFSKEWINTGKSNEPNIKSQKDIRDVLEGTRYIPLDNDISSNKLPAPGDLFWNEETKTYYINIRAQCSVLHKEKKELYCIEGKEVLENRIQKKVREQESTPDIIFQSGELRSKKNFVYIPFAHGNRILEFDCNNFSIMNYNDSNATLELSSLADSEPEKSVPVAKRIGRILPPYITHIQQILSAFIVREGLPAIPKVAITITDNPISSTCTSSLSSEGITNNTLHIQGKNDVKSNGFLKRLVVCLFGKRK